MAEPRRPRNRTTTGLPSEIILFNILPWLPVKSILRFTCVCKQWHSFVKTSVFAEIHLHRATNNDHQNQKLLVLSNTSPCKFSTIDCESPEDGVTSSRSLPFEASYENMRIITSYNGLVCVGITKSRYDNKYSDIILWNPLTGEYKILSKGKFHKECYELTGKAFGLYHTSSDDDYKLLRVTHDHDAYIYSLKSDSWKKIASPDRPDRTSERWTPTTPLNEKLYFFKRVKRGSTVRESYSVIQFDTKTERFRELAAPSFGNRKIASCLGFMVVRGCIHWCMMYDDRCGQWWRMDGDGDWTKLLQFRKSVHPLYSFKDTLHLTRNRDYLTHSKCKGRVYRIQSAKKKKVRACSYAAGSMDIPPTGKFIETFVSPNPH